MTTSVAALIVSVAGTLSSSAPSGFRDISAKMLFYDPYGEDPAAGAGALPSSGARPMPARPNHGQQPPRFVGIQYWFVDERGARFSDARALEPGVPARLVLRSNVSGFLTVGRMTRAARALNSRRGRVVGLDISLRRIESTSCLARPRP
jgi:hypothetical protein